MVVNNTPVLKAELKSHRRVPVERSAEISVQMLTLDRRHPYANRINACVIYGPLEGFQT